MLIKNHQKRFLELLQSKMPKGKVLGTLLMKLLNLSKDSAYRRLRAETSLTFDELIILANHFEVSLDTFLKLENNNSDTIFHHRLFDNNIYDYINWVTEEFTAPPFVESYDMIYAAKGLPIYYNFLFPEIALFKAFYYNKVLWKNPKLQKTKFDFSEVLKIYIKNESELTQIKNKILIPYLKTPSTEIWNEQSFDGHLNQVKFAISTGMFKDFKNEKLIVDKTKALLNYVKLQTEAGHKINLEKPDEVYAKYDVYFSETVNLEHTFWKNTNESKGAFTIQNIGDFIYTYDESFCNRSELYLRNVMEKGNLISNTNDKIRHKLFRKIEKQIASLEDLD